jgi:hypothetical protein
MRTMLVFLCTVVFIGLGACNRDKSSASKMTGLERLISGQDPQTDPESDLTKHPPEDDQPGLCKPEPIGDVKLSLTYNVTPNPSWQAGQKVVLYADARRNPTIGQEDIFVNVEYPGTHPRTSGQRFDFTLPGVKVGEKVIVQAYMCSELGSDCYPSDKDNPPSCSVEVRILGNLRPSCQPEFTWTGGDGIAGVTCQAQCL